MGNNSLNDLYKKVTLRTSATGTPQQRFAGVNDTVGQILTDAGVNTEKNDVTINGETVDLSFVPEAGDEIILQTKKYSSGLNI